MRTCFDRATNKICAEGSSSINLSIDTASAVAPYEQLRRQLADGINSGELAPGAKLPPVRKLATDLGLAANTVARAYRELEEIGLLRTAGRAGTFVAEPELGAEELNALQRLAAEFIEQAQLLGADPDRIQKTVAAGLAERR